MSRCPPAVATGKKDGEQKLGFVEHWEEARTKSITAPDAAIVSEPQDYEALDGSHVKAEDTDICVRALSVGAIHKAYPVTGAIATGAAANLSGTIVSEMTRKRNTLAVRLGHSSGVMQVEIELDGEQVHRAGVVRTARRIMDGYVYIR